MSSTSGGNYRPYWSYCNNAEMDTTEKTRPVDEEGEVLRRKHTDDSERRRHEEEETTRRIEEEEEEERRRRAADGERLRREAEDTARQVEEERSHRAISDNERSRHEEEQTARQATEEGERRKRAIADERLRRQEEETARRTEEETARRTEEETARRTEEETARRTEEETARRTEVEEEGRRQQAADNVRLRRDEEETARQAEEVERLRRIEVETARQADRRRHEEEETARKAEEEKVERLRRMEEETARQGEEEAERRRREEDETAHKAEEAERIRRAAGETARLTEEVQQRERATANEDRRRREGEEEDRRKHEERKQQRRADKDNLGKRLKQRHSSPRKQVVSTFSQLSTDATADKKSNRGLRERYRRVQQQFPEVLSRLQRQRASTPNKLDWPSSGRNSATLRTPRPSVNGVVRIMPIGVLNSTENTPVAIQSRSNASTVVAERKSSTPHADVSDSAPPPHNCDLSNIEAAPKAAYSHEMVMKNKLVEASTTQTSRSTEGRGRQTVDDQFVRPQFTARPKSAITTSGNRKQNVNQTYDGYYDEASTDSETGEEEEEGWSDAGSHRSFASVRSTSGRAVERQRENQTLIYFGIVRLPPQYRTIRPPVADFYKLEPMERAAYMYHYSLYNRYITDVVGFHKMFHYQYVRATWERKLSEEEALLEIVTNMRSEWQRSRAQSVARRTVDTSQMFSDDTPDDTRRDMESERSFDTSVISVRQSGGPLLHSREHALSRCGPFGQLVTRVHNSVVVTVGNVRESIVDPALRRNIECCESFGSALLVHLTQPHTVQLYIKRRLQCLNEEKADADVILLWRFLQLCVQQRGKVYGPDMATLLMDDMPVQQHYMQMCEEIVKHRDTETQHMCQLRLLCAGGHLREALLLAQRHNMWSEALFLAYKLGDYRVFDKFVSSYPLGDPVRTVSQLLGGTTPDVNLASTDVPIRRDDEGVEEGRRTTNWWREQAAVLLANMSNVQSMANGGEHVLQAIVQLAAQLSKCGRFAAADFCLLCVHMLGNWDVFDSTDKEQYCVTLLHAHDAEGDDGLHTIADHCKMTRFSLLDVQATCIYEYAARLADRTIRCGYAWGVQLTYAHTLASYGLHDDAMSFCMHLATGQGTVQPSKLDWARLHDLAHRLRYITSGDTAWVDSYITEEMPAHMLTNAEVTPGGHQVHKEAQAIAYEQQSVVSAVEPVTMTREEESSNLPASEEVTHERSEETTTTRSSEVPTVTTEDSRPTSTEEVGDDHLMVTSSRRSSIGRSSTAQGSSYVNSAVSTPMHHRQPIYDDRPPALPTAHEMVDQQRQQATPQQQPQMAQQQQQHIEQPPQQQQQHFEPQHHAILPPTTVQPQPLEPTGIPYTLQPHVPEMAQGEEEDKEQHSPSFTIGPPVAYNNGPPIDQIPPSNHQAPPMPVAEPVSLAAASPPPSAAPPAMAPSTPVMPSVVAAAPPPSVAPQTTPAAAATPDDSLNKSAGNSTSLFSRFTGHLHAKISGNAMILPDDANAAIKWDAKLNKYVGTGVDEEEVAEAPPMSVNPSLAAMLPVSQPNSVDPAVAQSTVIAPTVGLGAARRSGGSRYFNSIAATTTNATVDTPMIAPPMPSTQQYFGFMPAMPADDGDGASGDPFSAASVDPSQ